MSLCLMGGLALGAGALGCSDDTAGSQEPTSNDNNAGDDDGSEGDGDTGEDGSSGQDADSGSDAADTSGDDGGSDTPPSDAGDAGDVDPDDREDDECPDYQRLCDGECIPTSNDPDNCGACGNTCGDGEACSGGRCVDEGDCMSGLDVCDGSCVDRDTNNDHCGECGNACGDGEGCVEGECRPSLLDYDEPSDCDDGGPPIDVGDSVDEPAQCSGDLAERTFRWAMCSCSDVNLNNAFLADAYDSTLGPYQPGGYGGGVGANGSFSVQTDVEITGTLWISDDAGLMVNNDAEIGQRLYVAGAVDVSGTSVESDAYIIGPLGNAGLDIGGTLYVPPDVDVGGSVTYGDLQEDDNLDVGQACTECDPEDRVPIADIVDDHSDNNDNDAIGLNEDALGANNTDEVRLDLPCGNYYLSEVDRNATTTIVAHGNTALYIDGDMNLDAETSITVEPEGQLDVFVDGSIYANTEFEMGSANHPALMRMYVGGDDGIMINNRLRAGANLYAVPGGVDNNNRTEVYGSLYTGDMASNVEASFHYDRRVTTVGDECPDPDDDTPDPDPNPDAGDAGDVGYDAGDAGPGPGDGGDVGTGDDGGGDDLCKTEGESCSATGDCCSPLECDGDGECALLECKPLNESCEDDAECCSGTCGGGICIDG